MSQSIATHASPVVARTLIARAGITQDRQGRWVDATNDDLEPRATWAMDEALRWALVILAESEEPR